MWKRVRADTPVVRVLLSGGAVAVVTGAIALFDNWVPVLSLGALYVLAVVPVAVLWGIEYAIPVSIASMLAFNWFFLPPVHTFTLADSRNWFALAVYVVTAVVVSDLAARSRRRAREAALLTQIASSLLERGSVGAVLDDIAHGAATALRVDSAHIELGDETPPVAGEVGRALEVGGRRIGTIYLGRERRGSTAARRHVLPALASMLGVALDRERLERDAVEAEALRRSDTIKTAVLRAVSHDLRSPLMAISTSAGTLAHYDDALSDADRAELLDTILLESARLDHLVGNLLDLSRLQAGALQPERRLCSADDLVARAVDELGDDGARIDVARATHAPTVSVDPGQLQRVLVNLLENALKYSPPETLVRVTVAEVGEDVVIRVDDEGRGLAADELRRVFEPFQRGTSSSGVRGAGLGLAIARGFAEANGARVWAERTKEGGASFALAMPVVRVPAEVPA
jgi:two-component system sensor histidine kinase KdpD